MAARRQAVRVAAEAARRRSMRPSIFSAEPTLCTPRMVRLARPHARARITAAGWSRLTFRAAANTPARWRWSRGAADDEFTTTVKLQSVKGGPDAHPHRHRPGVRRLLLARTLQARGAVGAVPAPDDPVARDARGDVDLARSTSAEGRWFWGVSGIRLRCENGARVRRGPCCSAPISRREDRLAPGVSAEAFWATLAGEITPADLDFGTGVTVKRIVSHTSDGELVAQVDVAADAVSGKRDVALPGSVLQSAIAVYDKVDYIKVTPQSTIARLGSETHPKGYQQFEAIAYQRGADGKPNTADDVELGPIDVNVVGGRVLRGLRR